MRRGEKIAADGEVPGDERAMVESIFTGEAQSSRALAQREADIAAGMLFPLTGWLLSPMIAAAAMSFSSVSVIGNALRLQHRQLSAG